MNDELETLRSEWRSMGLSEEEISYKEKVFCEIIGPKEQEYIITETEKKICIDHVIKSKSFSKTVLILIAFIIITSLVFAPLAYVTGSFYFKYGLIGPGILSIVIVKMFYHRSSWILSSIAALLYLCTMFIAYLGYDAIDVIYKYDIKTFYDFFSENYKEFIRDSIQETLNDKIIVGVSLMMSAAIIFLAKGEYDEGDVKRAYKSVFLNNQTNAQQGDAPESRT